VVVAGPGRAPVVPMCRPSPAVLVVAPALMVAPVLVVAPALMTAPMLMTAPVVPVLMTAPVVPLLVMAPVPGLRAAVTLPSPMARRSGLHGGCRPWRAGGSEDPRDRHCDRGGRARDQKDLRRLRMRRRAGSACAVGRIGQGADEGADRAAEMREQATHLRHRQRKRPQNDVHGRNAEPKCARRDHAARPPRHPRPTGLMASHIHYLQPPPRYTGSQTHI
jgi:hypothetical protein